MSTDFAPYTGKKVILRKKLNVTFGDAPTLEHGKVYTVNFTVKRIDRVLVALSEVKHHDSGQAWCYNSTIFEPYELPECLTRFLNEDPNYLVVHPDQFDIENMRRNLRESFKKPAGYSSFFLPGTAKINNKKPSPPTSS